VINHVTQEDRSGCGLACVAMVAGMTYRQVRKIWLNCLLGDEGKLDTFGSGTTAGDLVNLLGHIGGFTMTVGRKNYHDGQWWSIADEVAEWRIAEVPTKWGSHWVVKFQGKTFDPAQEGK